jgi:thiamine-monophosphate kinase
MRRPRLGDIGEFGWIARLLRRTGAAGSRSGILLGLGDDAAVVRLAPPILVTTDVLVEGVHFRRTWGTPRQLGRRAFAVNASDIAAMGGIPAFALVDLRAPASVPVRYLDEVYSGFCRAAARYRTALVGGNTSRSRELSVAVTLLGSAAAGYATRAGCRVGDDLYVTGRLGLARAGLETLYDGKRSGVSVRRFLEPPVRVVLAQALVRTGLLGGMIDISDGCLQDLRHLCAASDVGAIVEAHRVPIAPGYRHAAGEGLRLALHGGEDYELLFSARPTLAHHLPALRRRARCPITRIGRIVAARDGLRVVDQHGQVLPVRHGGHDHFGRRGR